MATTNYYRASYVDSEGNVEPEVFIGRDFDSARSYAIDNACGRVLFSLEEFNTLLEAMTL